MIETQHLAIRAGSFILADINVVVPTGAYCAVMGKTGSGKTTLLEALCGLRQIVAGRVLFDGTDVTQLKPAERGIGLVPQDGALFETMTVRRHLEFALSIRGWKKAKINERVDELSDLLEIQHLLDRRPPGLSGGERQRVALGRALSFRPQILCLDEPLSALDDDTHQHLVGLLRRAHVESGVTAVHVTHNRQEAEALADHCLRIESGLVTSEALAGAEHVIPLTDAGRRS